MIQLKPAILIAAKAPERPDYVGLIGYCRCGIPHLLEATDKPFWLPTGSWAIESTDGCPRAVGEKVLVIFYHDPPLQAKLQALHLVK